MNEMRPDAVEKAMHMETTDMSEAAKTRADHALKTIPEHRRAAQAMSVEARRKLLREVHEQVMRDRHLAFLGMEFASRYVPPAVIPEGARVCSLDECIKRHRSADRSRDNDSHHERHLETHLNVSAIQIATYILGRGPMWVRKIEYGWETDVPTGPLPRAAWVDDYLVLAMQTASARYIGREPIKAEGRWIPVKPYHHTTVKYYLKPLDLCSHDDRKPLVSLPASTLPWADVLALSKIVYLTDLPCPSLRRVIRSTVGNWVKTRREYRLPWGKDPAR